MFTVSQAIQPNVEWNITNAKTALEKIKSNSLNSLSTVALAALASIAAGIALLCSAPIAITFTAAVIGGGSVLGYFYFSKKGSSLRKELNDQGLTTHKQIQLGLEAFSNELEKMSKGDAPYQESSMHPLLELSTQINPLFEGITCFYPIGIGIGIKAKDNSAQSSQFWVYAPALGDIDDDLKLALLNTTLKHHIYLQFSDFTKRDIYYNILGKINERDEKDILKAGEVFNKSALFAAKYLNQCLDKFDFENIDISAINIQLNCLAFQIYKEIDQQDTVHKYPAIALSKNERGQLVVDLTLFCFNSPENSRKAMSMTKEFIQLIDRNNIEIRINTKEFGVFPDEWKEFISSSINWKAKITDNSVFTKAQ